MSTQPTEQHTPTPQPETAKKKRPRVFHFPLPDRGDELVHTLCGFTFPKQKAIYARDVASGASATGEQRPHANCHPCYAMWELERELGG